MSARSFRGAAATAAIAAFLVPASLLAAAPALAHTAHTHATAHTPAQAPVTASAHGTAAPATVAKKLFGAWLRRDRHAAARVATSSAASTLFAYPFRAPDKFAGCSGNACRFVHTSVRVPGGLDGILMVVSGGKVTKVYESRHLVKPSDAAKHLFEAWRKGDRNRGLEAATTTAVKTLFRTKYDPKGVKHFFQGCSSEPKGYGCAYSYEGGAMFMHVRGSKSRGYEVTSITYIAD
ncbi:hypothetical protein FLW53_00220 [Microbispora sp. SCL1-1]|jgi:hypothetical protein|uniref:hypothetical protein n=1 Tax=Microbispora TaxID=2005 RepID=UPI001158FA5D|nr:MULTISPECIES: hypothetical protein [unclassified Microbispora]NJP22657.1 hypothetical protein [Microbispora sp. CL1-1]TQS16708.1 hypothetical protein FLW53_00220 [Microbispora sp. SCL1-1]